MMLTYIRPASFKQTASPDEPPKRPAQLAFARWRSAYLRLQAADAVPVAYVEAKPNGFDFDESE